MDMSAWLPDWVNWSNIGAWVSIVALALTVYVMVKVRGIAESRRKERQVFGKTLNIEGLDNCMREAANCLETVATASNIADDVRERAIKLRDEVVSRLGETSGVVRTLSEYLEETKGAETLELVPDYYSAQFVIDKVRIAKKIFKYWR
jgi:hypothetical protein